MARTRRRHISCWVTTCMLVAAGCAPHEAAWDPPRCRRSTALMRIGLLPRPSDDLASSPADGPVPDVLSSRTPSQPLPAERPQDETGAPRIDIETAAAPNAPKPDPLPPSERTRHDASPATPQPPETETEPGAQRPTPAPSPEGADGLEASTKWRAVAWAPAGQARVVPSDAQGSGQALRLSLTPDPEREKPVDKSGVCLRALPSNQITPEMSVRLRFHCKRGNSASLAVALEVGDGPTYYESKVITIRAGEIGNRSLALRAPEWKTERTEWRFETAVPAGRLHQLVLLLYDPQPDTVLLIDDLRITQ